MISNHCRHPGSAFPDSLARVILREKPTFIAAVPTLFEAILKSDKLKKKSLSFLKACFCGGDSLSPELKSRFEAFVRERGAPISLREGFGLTETVTVCCVNPEYASKEGSVGLPLPDMLMKIVHVGTNQELSPGGQGEICVSGPTVMLGYLNDPDGTAEAIHVHEDGRSWVHTGDFGYMDKDGYFFFTQRLKRIIKVSGVPVFPSQIEAVISSVPGVEAVCAISIPDSYRMHAVKAIVVPDTHGIKDGEKALRDRITAVCADKLIAYARPVEIEFRDILPKTLVGKVDYVLSKNRKSKSSPQPHPCDQTKPFSGTLLRQNGAFAFRVKKKRRPIARNVIIVTASPPSGPKSPPVIKFLACSV